MADGELVEFLAARGQSHLLADWDSLDGSTQAAFAQRIRAIDWDELRHPFVPPPSAGLGRSRVITMAERERRLAELTAVGEAVYAAGRVAVVMVAGGMGTRLGFDGPKGCFRAGELSGKSIYQLQAEKVLALSRRLGRTVPFLMMTSPATDAATRAEVATMGGYGLAPGQLRCFTQGTVPSIDADGRALLAAPGRLLENPDGHGGCFAALVASGELARLEREGITHIVYLQVDNLLTPVDDPVLVGLAEVEDAEVVTKVLEKIHPDEKLGHLVSLGGRDCIVEYTDLTPAQMRQRDTDGELIYRWGSPAMLCWSVPFLARTVRDGGRLPLHRSAKPLTAWVEGARREVRGWKCERFIFDLLPLARRGVGLEIDRAEEFGPIKNATGEDSVDSARRLLRERARRWLAAYGVEVSSAARVEIGPLYAATAAGLRARRDLPARITGDRLLDETPPAAPGSRRPGVC